MIPFRTGMRVTGKEFCGRQKEVVQLREYMQSAARVYVVGDRRIGKTSLVLEAARRVRGVRLVYADLMAIKTLADLSQRLAQALLQAEKEHSRVLALLKALASMRPALSVDPVTNAPSVSFEPGSGTRPETLDSIFRLLGSWDRAVVVLDEFQDILGLPDEDAVVARLRGLVQQQEEVAFVFCGSQRSRMEEIFTSPASPFFSSAMRLPVGPMERRGFRRFLQRKFEAGERQVGDGVLDAVLDTCHDNPGDAQRLCTALWQVTSAGQAIDETDLVEAWTMLFAMQRDQYEIILQGLSPQQTQVLRALSRVGGESNLNKGFVEETGVSLLPSVAKALEGLVQKRIVQKEGTTYRVCDPFLSAWLARVEQAPLG